MLANWQQGILDFKARKHPARILHAHMERVPAWRLFWTQDPPVDDEFLRELIASRPVQRLRRIGFLGAIDYLMHGNGSAPHRRRHNRFDHSVNVALLALRYAVQRDLDPQETRRITAAALLHDVGHGPLSHSLEPTFERLFQINHHVAGKAVVRGTSPLGRDIPEIFAKHAVNLEQVIELLGGADQGPHAFLFDSPVNLDTIEAIGRCCLLSQSPQGVPPAEFVDAIATQADFPIELADRFWVIKGTIYQTVILSTSGVIADTVAQQYMSKRFSSFSADDFFLDDFALRKKHPDLFDLFTHLRTRTWTEKARQLTITFDQEIEAPVRHFIINRQAPINSPQDLAMRYTQEKQKHILQVRNYMSGISPTNERA